MYRGICRYEIIKSPRSIELNDRRSVTASPLLKGGPANGAVFSVSSVRRTGVGQPAFRSRVRQKKPVRNDSRTHVTRRICASDLHMVRSLTGATFISLSSPPLPPSRFFPFLFLSSRIGASPPCLSTVDTPVAASARLVSSRGLREKGGARRPRGEALPGRPNFNRAYKSFE